MRHWTLRRGAFDAEEGTRADERGTEADQTRQHMDRLLDIVRDMSVALACMENRLIEANTPQETS